MMAANDRAGRQASGCDQQNDGEMKRAEDGVRPPGNETKRDGVTPEVLIPWRPGGFQSQPITAALLHRPSTWLSGSDLRRTGPHHQGTGDQAASKNTQELYISQDLDLHVLNSPSGDRGNAGLTGQAHI
ncbi:hypothetical protein DPEC_G00242760 [Dallia pectoralis]|uniref:Uncharacterized protein n=1 Tax=Dallia pectoralis TaxID=75939 RepID=A0ACC2FVD7_DALPE|nr:hypothetical protein DPEC_G00242760 [Dallia pectoralis]